MLKMVIWIDGHLVQAKKWRPKVIFNFQYHKGVVGMNLLNILYFVESVAASNVFLYFCLNHVCNLRGEVLHDSLHLKC